MSSTTTRRPYHGSCHCGLTKYTLNLSLPPSLDPNARASAGTRIRKCNCTTCHKMSFFHIRVPDAPRDFALLSPAGGPDDLKIYMCGDRVIKWPFCPECGVQCFAYWGKGERVEVDVGGGEKRVVWRPKAEWREGEGWAEGKNAYLTVNAATLDAGQEGLDLREWHEKGWINYLDCLEDKEENHFGRPCKGGMY